MDPYRADPSPLVFCCVCGERMPVAKADVVELGYRCPACTMKALSALSSDPVAAADVPGLVVPMGALIKPAGASATPAGHVTCLACGREMRLAEADIVGEGYRCAACSSRAEFAAAHGQSDAAAHLSRTDRRELSGAAGGMRIGGFVMLGLGLLLLASTDGNAGMYLTLGGAVSLIGGFVRS